MWSRRENDELVSSLGWCGSLILKWCQHFLLFGGGVSWNIVINDCRLYWLCGATLPWADHLPVLAFPQLWAEDHRAFVLSVRNLWTFSPLFLHLQNGDNKIHHSFVCIVKICWRKGHEDSKLYSTLTLWSPFSLPSPIFSLPLFSFLLFPSLFLFSPCKLNWCALFLIFPSWQSAEAQFSRLSIS